MWISDDERGVMLFRKIWICVGILCFLCPKIEGKCSKPELSENAVLHENDIPQNKSDFPESSSVRLTCIPGYVYAGGPRTVTCQDGLWNPNPQSFACKKKSCGSPGEVRNGQYNISEGIDFGAIVTAICNVGYYLVGDGQRICLQDGMWSGREAVCEVVKCGQPPNTIPNGQLESASKEEYKYGEVVVYGCNQGYTIFGNHEAICSQNGSWIGGPTCKLVECQRPNIPNGKRIEGNSGPYGYRDIVVYECNEGYKMDGEPRIVCEENGWIPAVPKCEEEKLSTTKPTSRTTVKETTTHKGSTSPDRTTPRTAAEATTKGGKNGAPLLHSSMGMVLATVITVAAQNGLFSLTL